MKIALITCERLPQGVPEDQPLFDTLKAASIDYSISVWSEPNDWSQFDACLLRSVWDYHENNEDFMNWVHSTSKVTRLLNPAEVIEWNSNKSYLKELADQQLNIAPTVWLARKSDINLSNEIIKLPDSAQYFLKPTIGADSSGTHRFNVDTVDSAQQHLNQWLLQHDMMLQSYLPSVETYGEVSAIYFNGKFSHAIRKIPVTGDYRVQDTFGASDVPHQLTAQEAQTAETANMYLKQKFGKLCYTRIDLLIDTGGQPVINELELIEPSLFFHHEIKAAKRLIQAIITT